MVRIKFRYLLFETIWQDGGSTSTQHELIRAVRQSLDECFGDMGAGRSASTILMKYYNPLTNIGIIRAGFASYRQVWGAMTFVRTVGARACLLRVLHVSGTIRKAYAAGTSLAAPRSRGASKYSLKAPSIPVSSAPAALAIDKAVVRALHLNSGEEAAAALAAKQDATSAAQLLAKLAADAAEDESASDD